jgi:MYXO-CTERM domain-containing protein
MMIASSASLVWASLLASGGPITPEDPYVLTAADGGALALPVGAADVNGDGHDDVLSLTYDEATADRALVVFAGGEDGPTPTPSQSITIGLAWIDAVITGDVDGDGLADVVVGTATETTADGVGVVRLFSGAPEGLGESPTWSYAGTQSADGGKGRGLGSTVVMDDFDGDGHPDLAVVARDYTNAFGAGQLLVFLGSDAGFSAQPDQQLDPTFVQPSIGHLLRVGDIDGDGMDELAVLDFSSSSTSKVRLYGGDPAGLAATDEVEFEFAGIDYDWVFGGGPPVTGDFDGDGRGDIVYYDTSALNGVLVRPATAAGYADSPILEIASPIPENDEGGPLGGFSTSFSVGQLDGDFADDLVIASELDENNPTWTGYVHAVASGAGGLPDTVSGTIVHEPTDYRFAYGVWASGDVDGDGFADVATHVIADEVAFIRVYRGRAFTPCDADSDGDGICDADDNCPDTDNPTQEDLDDDGVGDLCEGDGGESSDGTTDGASTGADTTAVADTSGDGGTTIGATTDVASETGGADGETGVAEAESASTGCGCTAAPSRSGAWWLVALGGLALRRRRRSLVVAVGLGTGCGSSDGSQPFGVAEAGDESTTTSAVASTSSDGESSSETDPADAFGCCSEDRTSIVECTSGEVREECAPTEACFAATVTCVDGCASAIERQDSLGCEYYAAALSTIDEGEQDCFAVIISNTWPTAAHVKVDQGGAPLDLEGHVVLADASYDGDRILPSLELLDPGDGIPPGATAALLLAGPDCAEAGVPDGVTPLRMEEIAMGSGMSSAFHITSDVPVTAHQVRPFLGAYSAITGATMLYAVPSWGDNFTALAPAPAHAMGFSPTLSIVAAESDTTVEILAPVELVGVDGPSTPANTPVSFTLAAGDHLQFVQPEELTGAIIDSDKPIGVWVGHECTNLPAEVFACDHLEQMLLPHAALGSSYVAAPVQRIDEPGLWRVFGVVDDTELSYQPDVSGPASLDRGEAVWIQTSEPFVVASQDEDHPFYMFNYMTGGQPLESSAVPSYNLIGDPDFVGVASPLQWLTDYTFFLDPGYLGELVFVRERQGEGDSPGLFSPVEIDCGAELGDRSWREIDGWVPIADGRFEYVRVETWNPDAYGCVGRTAARSERPFGLTVWGLFSYTSLAFVPGLSLDPLNDVVIPVG